MKLIRELCEVLTGRSLTKIEWFEKTEILKVGFFTFDEKTIYCIRRIRAEYPNNSGFNEIAIYDFGDIVNEKINYKLHKDSKTAFKVFNVVYSEMLKDIKNNNIVVFLAKQANSDSKEDFKKRVNVYEVLIYAKSAKSTNFRYNEYYINNDAVFIVYPPQLTINPKDVYDVVKSVTENTNWIQQIRNKLNISKNT